MAETWLDKCDSFYNNIINGNHKDARAQLKSYSRKQRYICISYIKGCDEISESDLWEYIKIVITGDFNR